MEYFFVLGEHPDISAAEIFSRLRKEATDFEARYSRANLLIIESAGVLDAAFLMRRLGGTIKIGVIEKKLDLGDKKFWAEELAQLVLNTTKEDKKTYFGLSVYGPAIKTLPLGLEIKKTLVKAGRKVRLVTSREPTLSSVVVQTNKLLSDNGAELVIMGDGSEAGPALLASNQKGRAWAGRTLAVQPFAELSRRDYGRPARDAAAGMLPPKLAMILINLAEIDAAQTLLDPFCGSGTILTEAALMDYKNIIGSDNSDLAINNTQRNIAWIATCKGAPCGHKGHPCKIAAPKIQLKKCDVRTLSRCWPPKSIEAIVTEPWLGPPLTGREAPEKIKNIVNELGQLYLSAFNQFKKVLKKDGRVVFILPAFKKNDRWENLPILEQIMRLGFKSAGDPLFYSRPDQKVGRQIVRFTLQD